MNVYDEPAALLFVDALFAFNCVRISCFGDILMPEFETKIAEFRTAYFKLPITVTTSVNVDLDHLVQLCRFKKAFLGVYSEQASESVHSDFSAMWEQCG